MSLLDQMKAQAQLALEERSASAKLNAETLAERNAKLKEIFDYWNEFSSLTKVIQPDFPYPIALPRVGEMSGLKVADLFADYRYSMIGTQNFSEEINHVSLYFYYKSQEVFQFEREVGLATRVEDELWRYGIVHTTEHVKNEQSRTIAVAFNVPWQIKGSVVVTVIPNSKVLHFDLKNVAKLGDMELDMPFERVSSEFLDQLSMLLLGKENRFWALSKL